MSIDNSWKQKEIKTLNSELENEKEKGGNSKEKEKGKEYLGIKSKNTMLSTWIASILKIESCNTQILINNNVERNEKLNGQWLSWTNKKQKL
jgi:hypothetical protein